MKSKRGSHVGVILSFIIFVTFLVYLYLILQPSLKTNDDKQKLLENLKINLNEKFSSNLETINFAINGTTTENCVDLQGLVSQLMNGNLVVKNESGGLIANSRKFNNDLLIDRSSISDTFFKVYDSEELNSIAEENIPGCEPVANGDYVFKSANLDKEVFLSLINQTLLEYESNYSGLKEELNIPQGSDFAFSFTDKKTILIKTPEQNVSASVYADESPVLFVDSEANINPGFLTIKVW